MPHSKNYIHKPSLPIFSEKSKAYQVVSGFLAVRADKLDMARLASQLKNVGNNAMAGQALGSLFGVVPFARGPVWGNTCPKEVAQLGNGENCYFFEPKSLEREVSWCILGLKPYAAKLHDFVVLRNQVERHILLGNYSEAKELLEQSIKLFGYSVWYYEMRLTIAGSQHNIEEGIAILTNVNEIYRKEEGLGIVPILLQHIYNRSFTNTPLRYDNMVVSTFKRNRDKGNRFDYYLFRLNYYQYADLENLSEVVNIEQFHATIDRYILLLYVLRSCYIYQSKKRETVLRYVRMLYNLSGDPQLLPFFAISGDLTLLPDSYYDVGFVAILDNYYAGNYRLTADLCRQYLDDDPSNLYVIKLFCRSLMFLGNGFQSPTYDNESLLHQIAFYIYRIMVEKHNEEFIEKLNTTLKNIYGLRIAAQIDQFVRAESREPHSDYLAYLSITCFDPYFIRAIEEETRQKNYLEEGIKHIPESITIQYRKECIERIISPDSPVVSYIRDVDTAKIIYDKGDYGQALVQWQKIFDENHQSIPTCQTAVEYIFRSLIALGISRRQEAVAFYVNCFMENRSFVSKIDTDQFMVDLKRSRYDGVRNGLDLMIFVFLNADKYPQKQFVLERYCKYEHVTYPSELIPKFRSRDREKVELFLSILLNDDILYHHYKLRSTIEVLDEKLKIVNYLKAQYPKDQLYSDIYTELMHELVAYRGMNKMDDSKIYVNEDAVMKYELCNIEPLYERFRKQAALARKGGTVLLVGGINFNDPNGLSEIIQDTVSYSNDAVADVAKELFDFIRLAFLKSRFGLGTYLSTRIRHGVFEGEMRSFLERLDLILSTNQGSYVPETHWHHHYHMDHGSRDLLNKALKAFSYDTDHLISNFKDNVIQIRVDNNDTNRGLFCYDQPTEVISRQLMRLEYESANVQEFCQKVMEWLWQITERCLETIRDRVQNELRPSFTSNIDSLESCIERINTHDRLRVDMLTAINNAREELNSRLVKVEKWFYRQEAKMEDFRLSDHAKMAFDTTDKYATEVIVNMNVDIPLVEPQFKAQYSASMFDLLLIFFSNIFKYSFEEYKRPVIFQVTFEEDDMMHIHMENRLRAGVNEEEENRKFNRLINEEAMIQKEHGSGLAKAMNIIKYDFGNPENTYTIVAREGKCYTDIFIHLTNMVK